MAMFRKEPPRPSDETTEEAFGLDGKINILLLAGIVGAVLLSGIWQPGISFDIYHVEVGLPGLVRDALLLLITWLSWKLTSRENRQANGFSWFPKIGRASCRERVCQYV